MKLVILESPFAANPKPGSLLFILNNIHKRGKTTRLALFAWILNPVIYVLTKWEIAKNIRYARACVRDSLSKGEAPIASHLLYTQAGILNDHIDTERQWGIDAGLAWKKVAEGTVVYTDKGISKGMEYGIRAAQFAGLDIEFRSLKEKGTYLTSSITINEQGTITGRIRGTAMHLSNSPKS